MVLFGWRKRNNTFRLDFLVLEIRLGEEIGMSGLERESERVSAWPVLKAPTDEVSQVLRERFATGNELDQRKSFSFSRISVQTITMALCSIVTVQSLN